MLSFPPPPRRRERSGTGETPVTARKGGAVVFPWFFDIVQNENGPKNLTEPTESLTARFQGESLWTLNGLRTGL